VLIESFRDSLAWHKAHELTLAVYRESSSFPKTEVFGLTNQLRRADASIGANLAQGYGRHARNELRRFSMIANGSLQEVRNFLLLSSDLGYLGQESLNKLMSLADEAGKLIGGIERSLR
jgi:four helix bundle protein